jgi:hypothetical protein
MAVRGGMGDPAPTAGRGAEPLDTTVLEPCSGGSQGWLCLVKGVEQPAALAWRPTIGARGRSGRPPASVTTASRRYAWSRALEARRLYGQYSRVIDDLGNLRASAHKVFGQWELEMLAGQPRRAEAAARASLELFHQFGATNPGLHRRGDAGRGARSPRPPRGGRRLRRPRRVVGRARRHRLAGRTANRARARPRRSRRHSQTWRPATT